MTTPSEDQATTSDGQSASSVDPDWRIRVVTHLAKNVPAAFPGGPSHKAGALVVQSTAGKDAKGRNVSFTTPSVVALALSLAIKAAERARELQAQIKQSDVMTPFGPGTSVTHDSTPLLFDYLEQCMATLAFSFQALEAFSNETITLKLSGTYPLERKKVIYHVSADELERQASTEEKLGTVLPKLLGIATPKGSRLWNDFVDLKRTRDATIHIKSHDSNPRVTQPSDLEEATLFHRFLHADVSGWVKAAVALLDYFAAVDPQRWLAPVKKALGMRGSPHATNQKKQNQKLRGER